MVSIDGRIVVNGWPLSSDERRYYELVHASYEPDGWICGRVTMEPFAKRVRSDAETASERTDLQPREDFRAPGAHSRFAFAIDSGGRLAWETNEIDGDHVVAILSERVSDEYLAFLRDKRVSYVLAGSRTVDLSLALDKIGASFGVRTLMLEGGGRINGAMLRANLIDEVSVLIAPVADGRVGTATLFDVDGVDSGARRLALESVDRRGTDVVWLRYRVEANGHSETARESALEADA
jgi:2,5-diamino-6-(ribosylamino)-4(3H)-pyrimidinone 5'-phosphate reductase